MSFNYSGTIDEILSQDDPLFWSRPTPIDCNTMRTIGFVLCIASLIGIVCNGTLFCSFIRYKNLRTPSNIFVMFIAATGLLGSCIILPFTGTSSIYCRWRFQRVGCQFEAILAFLYGCSSSYLLCGVSLCQCYIIIRPFQAKNITVNKCYLISIIAIGIAFFWTMLPLMGWNEYTLEGSLTLCSINWYDRRPLYISFHFFLFVMVYLIPLIILFTSNIITLIGLKRMKDNIKIGIQTVLNRKRIEMEKRILKSITITICGFIFTWTPYAVISFTLAFTGKDYALPPLATFLCSCFAKSSIIWIPILYVSTSTHFKFNFINQNTLEHGIRMNRINVMGSYPTVFQQRRENIEMNPVHLNTQAK